MACVMRILCMMLDQLPIQVEIQLNPQLNKQHFILIDPSNQRVLYTTKLLYNIGINKGDSRHNAEKIYPKVIFINAKEKLYQKIHIKLQNILSKFNNQIESSHLGEYFIYTNFLANTTNTEELLLNTIIKEITYFTQLSATAAIADTKFAARCAALRASPTRSIPKGKDADFLKSLSIKNLPNSPKELLRRLDLFGIKTIGEFANIPHDLIMSQFGSKAFELHTMSRGKDNRTLNHCIHQPNIRYTKTSPDPICNSKSAEHLLQDLSYQISQYLIKNGYHTQAIKLSIKDEKGHTQYKRNKLQPPTYTHTRIQRISINMFTQIKNINPITHITLEADLLHPWHTDAYQLNLFNINPQAKNKYHLTNTINYIKDRFGEKSIQKAKTISKPTPDSIKVKCTSEGIPITIQINKHTHLVKTIHQHWRSQSNWWNKCIRKDYYQLNITNGRLITVFSTNKNNWFLDRQ